MPDEATPPQPDPTTVVPPAAESRGLSWLRRLWDYLAIDRDDTEVRNKIEVYGCIGEILADALDQPVLRCEAATHRLCGERDPAITGAIAAAVAPEDLAPLVASLSRQLLRVQVIYGLDRESRHCKRTTEIFLQRDGRHDVSRFVREAEMHEEEAPPEVRAGFAEHPDAPVLFRLCGRVN